VPSLSGPSSKRRAKAFGPEVYCAGLADTGEAARAVLQDAGAIHDRLDASEHRLPILEARCSRDIEDDFGYRRGGERR
jgi:hypothetical protein